jgi:hypothetical protein
MARNSLNVLRSKIPRMRARPRRFVAEIRIGVPVGTLIKHRGGGIATAPQIRDSRLKMTERKREREREREGQREKDAFAVRRYHRARLAGYTLSRQQL